MLIWWYCFIAEHQVPELVRFATTVSAWENEFLAFFDQRVTNGRTEGRNRTIKHVKRLSVNRCSLVSLRRVRAAGVGVGFT